MDAVPRRAARRARGDDGHRGRRRRPERHRDGDPRRRPLRHRPAAPAAGPGRAGRRPRRGATSSAPARRPTASAGSQAMVDSDDGFELAEVDLEVRGEGTLFDTRQKGRTDLKLASLLRDRPVVERGPRGRVRARRRRSRPRRASRAARRGRAVPRRRGARVPPEVLRRNTSRRVAARPDDVRVGCVAGIAAGLIVVLGGAHLVRSPLHRTTTTPTIWGAGGRSAARHGHRRCRPRRRRRVRGRHAGRPDRPRGRDGLSRRRARRRAGDLRRHRGRRRRHVRVGPAPAGRRHLRRPRRRRGGRPGRRAGLRIAASVGVASSAWPWRCAVPRRSTPAPSPPAVAAATVVRPARRRRLPPRRLRRRPPFESRSASSSSSTTRSQRSWQSRQR